MDFDPGLNKFHLVTFQLAREHTSVWDGKYSLLLLVSDVDVRPAMLLLIKVVGWFKLRQK